MHNSENVNKTVPSESQTTTEKTPTTMDNSIGYLYRRKFLLLYTLNRQPDICVRMKKLFLERFNLLITVVIILSIYISDTFFVVYVKIYIYKWPKFSAHVVLDIQLDECYVGEETVKMKVTSSIQRPPPTDANQLAGNPSLHCCSYFDTSRFAVAGRTDPL